VLPLALALVKPKKPHFGQKSPILNENLELEQLPM